MEILPGIEIWKTPGHTFHDISVIVRNVAGFGTVAIVGKHLLKRSLKRVP